MNADKLFPNDRYVIQTIYDYVQTHAIYGVSYTDVERVKKVLKQNGCTKFRIVKANAKNLRIICFLKK